MFTQGQLNNEIQINLPTNGLNEIQALALRSTLTDMTSAIFQGLPWISITALPGVTANSVTNDTAALQSSINALSASGGAVVVIPNNTFSVVGGTAGQVLLPSNVYFLGANPTNCGFKQLTPENNNIFVGVSINNSGFENLAVYGADAAGSAYASATAIAYVTSTNWFVRNVTFYNEPTYGIAFYGGSRFVIESNKFNLTTASGTYQNCGILGTATNAASSFLIRGNFLTNTGMLVFGSLGNIDGNIIVNTGYGAAIDTSSLVANLGVNVINNLVYTSLHVLDVNGVMPGGIEATTNYANVSNNVVSQMGGQGIVIFGGSNTVSSNIVIDSGQGGNSSFANGIVAAYASPSLNASGSIFSNNISGNTGGGTTQLYGYSEYNGGSLSAIQLIGNNFSNNATGRVNIASSSTIELSGQNILLPTSNPHVTGQPWLNSGVLTVS